MFLTGNFGTFSKDYYKNSHRLKTNSEFFQKISEKNDSVIPLGFPQKKMVTEFLQKVLEKYFRKSGMYFCACFRELPLFHMKFVNGFLQKFLQRGFLEVFLDFFEKLVHNFFRKSISAVNEKTLELLLNIFLQAFFQKNFTDS